MLWAILVSVVAVMLETVRDLREDYGSLLVGVEWIATALFSVEYVLRLLCAPRPLRYARSFFGIVDLVAVLPSYLSLLVPGSQSLLVIRALRLLRVFRVFKLSRYLGEANILVLAMRMSRFKVTVFFGAVLSLVVIMGALMYLIEGEENGFTSVPRGVYWAVVTLTTVGYGDIAPKTPLGQVLASIVMVLGYSVIAVPAGIVTASLTQVAQHGGSPRVCGRCESAGHDVDALHCKYCGARLRPSPGAQAAQ